MDTCLGAEALQGHLLPIAPWRLPLLNCLLRLLSPSLLCCRGFPETAWGPVHFPSLACVPSSLHPPQLPDGEPLFQLLERGTSPDWAGFTVPSEWLFSGALLNGSSLWRQSFDILQILYILRSVRAGQIGLGVKGGMNPWG